jgi:hypothetical protein
MRQVVYRILAKRLPNLGPRAAHPWRAGSYGACMKRTHALLIALVLAFAVVAGTLAALRTTQLGTRQTTAVGLSSAQIAQRNRALDRAQAALLAELRKRPPALPAVHTVHAVTTPRPAPAQTVVYVRPKPIVHVIHRHGGESESGGDSAQGGAGASFDD